MKIIKEILTTLASILVFILGGFLWYKSKGSSLDKEIDNLKDEDLDLEKKQIKNETVGDILKKKVEDADKEPIIVETLTPDDVIRYWDKETKK